MRVLYGIQATGNGHLSRATEIIPHLRRLGDLDLLVSGIQSDIELPYTVKYRFKGMSFIFGKRGGVNIIETYRKNKIRRYWNELNQVPVENYDLVISDFEPITAWASILKGRPCVGLSNQCTLLTRQVPKPNYFDPAGWAVLKYYAPTSVNFGFHFEKYNDHIFNPVIRKEIRQAQPKKGEYYTVYLPAYDDERLVNFFSSFPGIKWEVFSKHNKKPISNQNVSIRPVNKDAFLKSLINCKGVVCAAGFGTTSEALFLGKKLMIVPMKGQYEQQFNAVALKNMGVPILSVLKEKEKNKVGEWLETKAYVEVNYKDEINGIIEKIVETKTIAEINNLPENKLYPLIPVS